MISKKSGDGRHKPEIRTEKVIRIVRMGTGYTRILFWKVKTPLYGKAVVGYRHHVDGKGPYTCNMEPFVEPPEDTKALIKLWKVCGSITTPGAKA